MTTRWLTLAALLGIAFLASGTLGAAADVKKPSEDDVKKAKELAGQIAKGGDATVFTDESLLKLFPGQFFVGVRYRQYPVAMLPPEPLMSFNLFVVKDGKATLIKDGLEKYFKSALPAVKDDATAKEAVKAYLLLAQEMANDGFYKFKMMDDSTKVVAEKGARKATGLVMATQGGNGEITVALDFDDAGKLAKATEGGKLKPGPRPICQATKLLDADPIVRKMAEQDLLIMGRAAHAYLMEQRAKANPDLQKAIDRMWQRILEDDK
ncbi:MAG: hypothetical protein K2R98_02490 [Gemmataceae bacterium]|nr:hypothetical protein [Gemmataceae bacterium]